MAYAPNVSQGDREVEIKMSTQLISNQGIAVFIGKNRSKISQHITWVFTKDFASTLGSTFQDISASINLNVRVGPDVEISQSQNLI